MNSYSPYDNLAAKRLSGHAGGDFAERQSGHVLGAGEIRGEAARAQDRRQSLLLLRTNMDAGHGGASGRYEYLKEIAFTYAFILGRAGHHPLTHAGNNVVSGRRAADPGMMPGPG